jgi:ASC-1-like (ASCH) protein
MEDTKELITMEISEPYFSFIRSGIKKVEGRKKSPTWERIRFEKKLLITCQNKVPFAVKTKNIRYYPSSPYNIDDPLTTYLACEGLNQVLPGTKTLNEGRNIYLKWSSQEEINKYGMMAIELEYTEDFPNKIEDMVKNLSAMGSAAIAQKNEPNINVLPFFINELQATQIDSRFR